ncbi:MAG: Kynurenine formamidase [Flavobacteriaceae bacterium]|jgi:kynurenine formamidase|nr:cyclase family protein [Flavobacteriaceae bacterium]CAI8198159.1 MAG: Kynurenine formamidase [Flavobacteriaceae bacterium]
MIRLTIEKVEYVFDETLGIDLSRAVGSGVNAWYIGSPQMGPLEVGGAVYSVSSGAAVNFDQINFAPHAHGTHTETFGHIDDNQLLIEELRLPLFIPCKLIRPSLETIDGDQVLTEEALNRCDYQGVKALVVRLNSSKEYPVNYDHTNWPYLSESATKRLVEAGVEHLVLDVPSIDKEKDQGALLSHRAFWKGSESTRSSATITEFAQIPADLSAGSYLLQLQVAPILSDAAPSRPILFKPL